MPSSSLPLSVLILTFNEEQRLPACLASVVRCEDVVVLDSGSTDQTLAIARATGARVYTNPFENFAAQRNHAHEAINFRHELVFHLDADECLTPELAAECAALDPAAPFDGYYAAPRMMFDGRWLRHCTDFPAWQARCVRAKGFRFVQAGHGQREAPEMRMGFLRANYLHDISVQDESAWEAKHRRYASEEAAEALSTHRAWFSSLRQLVAGSSLERRRVLKQFSYVLPGRPALRFFYQYYLRRGYRDGPSARRYCQLLARYEGFTVEEIRRRRSAH